MTVRIAATGDVHVGIDSQGILRPHVHEIPSVADVLLVAGDFTMWGAASEAKVFAGEVADLGIPMFGVLGNHDFQSDESEGIVEALADGGLHILECEGAVIDVDGTRVGIAGTKGFGGGFEGASGTEFGEPEMKAFIRHTRDTAERFGSALAGLDCDVKVALLHYSPIEETLKGERLEIYPFLGSYLLGQAIDRAGADIVLHGHAHGGHASGNTPGGIPVHNVAQHVIAKPYEIFKLEPTA